MTQDRWNGWSSGGATGADSDQDRWATPPEVFGPLDLEFGYGLDAAARGDNAKVRENWLGPDHPNPARRDGSSALAWVTHAHGRPVWCNPPYSTAGTFARAAQLASIRGVTSTLLVFARTDTTWWWEHVLGRDPQSGRRLPLPCAAEIRWRAGRITFLDPETGAPRLDAKGAPTSAPAPSVLLVYRPNTYAAWPHHGVFER